MIMGIGTMILGKDPQHTLHFGRKNNGKKIVESREMVQGLDVVI
jgi:hypothetical protein